MFQKNDKNRLYWLMDLYIAGKINAETFCDEFWSSYDLEIDDTDLTDLEQELFKELSNVASRFSEFEEDHVNYPGTYFTERELREKIYKVVKILRPGK